MASRSIAERIAELEKSLTAIPKVAHTIAHALRSKLFGEAEQPPEGITRRGRRGAEEPPPLIPAEELSLGDGDLPEAYGRTRLVLLAVDPRQVHAYWEVTAEKLAGAREAIGLPDSPPAILRFYDSEESHRVQGLPAASFDVPVDLRSRNWYVHLWSPGKSYYVELGLKGGSGQFVSLARSNEVRTPRAWPVMHVQEHFMRVDAARPGPELLPPPAFVPAPVFVPPRREAPLLAPKEVSRPAVESPASTPPPPSGRYSHARIDSEEVMKGKLTDLFAVRLAHGRPEAREVLPAPDSDLSLTSLAEKHFVPGIFSGAPGKTAEKT